jgi:hypothetical protein
MSISNRPQLVIGGVFTVLLLSLGLYILIDGAPRSHDPDYLAVHRVIQWLEGHGDCQQRVEISISLPVYAAQCEPAGREQPAHFISAKGRCVLKNSTAPHVRDLRIGFIEGRKVIVGSKTGYVFEVNGGSITDFYLLPLEEIHEILSKGSENRCQALGP